MEEKWRNETTGQRRGGQSDLENSRRKSTEMEAASRRQGRERPAKDGEPEPTNAGER